MFAVLAGRDFICLSLDGVRTLVPYERDCNAGSAVEAISGIVKAFGFQHRRAEHLGVTVFRFRIPSDAYVTFSIATELEYEVVMRFAQAARRGHA